MSHRFSLALSALVLLLLLAVAGIFVSLSERDIRQNLVIQQSALVSALAGELDRQLLTLQNALVASTESIPREVLDDPERLQRFLASRPTLRSVFYNVLVLSPEGIVMAANPLAPGFVGTNLGGMEYVARTRESRRPQISSPFISPFNQHALFVVACPVLDEEGKVLAIIAGSVYFRQDKFFASLTENRIGKGGLLVLLTRERQVLAHPDAARVMSITAAGANPGLEVALREGYFSGESVNSLGVPSFATYQTLKSTGWLLVSSLPLEEAYGSIYALQKHALEVVLLLALALPLLMAAAVYFLARPLRHFRDHIHALSHGQASPHGDLLERQDELGELTRSVHGLMEARDQASELLERQLALYAALGETNQALVHAAEPLALFKELCRIAVEHGHFRMAWIGQVDEFHHLLSPVAWAGMPGDYLEGLQITLTDESPLAHGPSGSACRSGMAYICNDFFADPCTEPWRAKALEANFKSSAAFPFFRGGQVAGAFTLYAEVVGYFDGRMVELLERMAQDISFALDHLAREQSRQRAEVALETAYSRLNGIIDGSRDLIAAWDPQCRLIAANSAFKAEMRRAGGAEVELGMAPVAWLAGSPAERQHLETLWRRPLAGESFVVEEQTTEGRWFETSYYPIRDAAAVIIGASHIVRDVTSRRLALESLRLLNRAVAQSPASIVITDTEGNIRYVNDSFCRVSGYSREEALGQNTRLLRSGQMPKEVYQDLWATIAAGRTWTGRLLNRRKNGALFWESALIQGIADDEGYILNYLAVKEDITAVMAAETAVRELNASLERRVKERTAALDRAMKDLEAFAYSVSHDLRAPLRAISGFSQILMDTERANLSDEGQGLLGRVVHNALHMAQLIDDILAYSRAGNMALEWRELDLAALARAVAGELGPAYPGVEVLVADMPRVRGDATMLRQILANLIGNALKFSAAREQGRVDVDCRQEAGETVFEIRDNGVGFDMHYAGKLFGMFQRMHPASQFPGTGVGLAIVKRLVERHGGRIWASSAPGQGAVFKFTLAAPEAVAALPAP